MNITKITYKDADNTSIEIKHLDSEGVEVTSFSHYPTNNWLDEIIQMWLDKEGNSIEPYVAPAPDLKAEAKVELAQLDMQAIRPLRAIAAGTDTQYDIDKLAQLDARAVELRAIINGDT